MFLKDILKAGGICKSPLFEAESSGSPIKKKNQGCQ
jgi:hypothetical protein